MRIATVGMGFCNFFLPPIQKLEILQLGYANTLVMGDYKDMTDKKPSGDAAKEDLFDPQALEAYLKFLETEFTSPAAEASLSEPDEPTNGWPGYPFL